MEPFFISTLIVAISEMGDKTQLLAFVLAARFKKPAPIILGVFCATLLNHALAGIVGEWIATHLSENALQIIVGLSFLAVGIWALKPDTLDKEPTDTGKWGAFGITLVAFFFAEIGDKTQIATVALAMKYHQLVAVVLGTTLGMMLANIPAVLIGDALAHKLPLKLFRYVAASIFIIMAVLAFCGVGINELK